MLKGLPLGSKPEYPYFNWTEYLFADFGWVNSNEINSKNPVSGFGSFRFGDVKTDVGVSVNFSVVRFELAWWVYDILGTPVFWVRLNPVF